MKIAVCDDSREDRGALRALLEACGHDFEIREYGSGEELYADMGYVRECGIVFLDINMEGMDGLEAAGRIKAECPKVHIVLVTAYVNYALEGYWELNLHEWDVCAGLLIAAEAGCEYSCFRSDPARNICLAVAAPPIYKIIINELR